MTPGRGITGGTASALARVVRQRVDGQPRRQLVDGGVVATGQHAAPEVPARGHRVDPRHRVAEVAVALVHHRQQRVEVGGPLGVDGAAARLDRQQADRGVEDDAGEAHPADRRPEQLGARSVGDSSTTVPSARSSDRRATLEPNEPSTWWFLPWMSLAMAPPTVTKRVPGVTGTKKPRGHEHPQQLVEADAGRHGGRRRRRRRDGVVGVVLEAQHGAPAVLRRVAVRAPEPAGDAATRPAGP